MYNLQHMIYNVYTVTDYTVTDHTVTDYTVADYTVTDQTVTDYTVTDYTVTDYIVTDYTVTDYTVTLIKKCLKRYQPGTLVRTSTQKLKLQLKPGVVHDRTLVRTTTPKKLRKSQKNVPKSTKKQ